VTWAISPYVARPILPAATVTKSNKAASVPLSCSPHAVHGGDLFSAVEGRHGAHYATSLPLPHTCAGRARVSEMSSVMAPTIHQCLAPRSYCCLPVRISSAAAVLAGNQSLNWYITGRVYYDISKYDT
jgi:hypothetical protein